MLSFIAYILEARKNPSINTKFESAYKEFEEIISTNNLDKSRLYVTLSYVNKLGINPRATYTTPFGIYVYPYRYFEQHANTGMPYRNSATYGILIELKESAKIFDIIGMDKSEFLNNIKKLTEYCNTKFVNFDNKLLDYNGAARSYGEKLYRIIHKISDKYSKKSNTGLYMIDEQVPLLVSNIIRNLGYDFVYDDGAGIIHDNEPVQGFIVNRQAIEKYFTVINRRNKTIPDDSVRNNIRSSFIRRYTKTNLIVSNNKLHAVIDSLDVEHNYSWIMRKLKSRINYVNSELVKLFSKIEIDKPVSMKYSKSIDNKGTTYIISTIIDGESDILSIDYSVTIESQLHYSPISVTVKFNDKSIIKNIPLHYGFVDNESIDVWNTIKSFVETNLVEFK